MDNHHALAVRAEWVLKHIRRHPGMRYDARIQTIRRQLLIGKGAAEIAYTRAMEMHHTHADEIAKNLISSIVVDSMEDIDSARRAGDWRAANRIRMDLSRMLGLHAPDKVEHTFGDPVIEKQMEELSDEELALFARVDRAKAIDATSTEPSPIDHRDLKPDNMPDREPEPVAEDLEPVACALCGCLTCVCATLG